MASVPLTSHSTVEQPKPSYKLWSIVYVFTVAVLGFFVLGFSMGFTSPVLADLKEEDGYDSLRKSIYQDLFNVRVLVVCNNCIRMNSGRGAYHQLGLARVLKRAVEFKCQACIQKLVRYDEQLMTKLLYWIANTGT